MTIFSGGLGYDQLEIFPKYYRIIKNSTINHKKFRTITLMVILIKVVRNIFLYQFLRATKRYLPSI